MGRGQVRRDRGSSGGDRGAAAVEFALVALPLFLILFGIIQYGFLFSQVLGAEATARDAADWASVGIDDCAEWQQRTKRRAEGNGVSGTPAPSGVATYDLSGPDEPTVTVSVTFTPSQFVPFIPVPDTVTRSVTTRVQSLTADSVTDSCP